MWIVLTLIVIAVLALLFVPAFKGYRTQIAAWATAVIGGALPLLTEITGLLQGFDWQTYVAPSRVPLIMLGLGALFAVLRFLTTGPVGGK